MEQELQYHIHLTKKQGARYAVLPGDPGRVKEIAAALDFPVFIAANREFTTWCGKLDGEKVLVTSTGIGGPSAAIALEELHRCGVNTIIRVGTCGGMQPAVQAGSLVIPTAAVRMEGTSKEYVPLEYPAVADFSVVQALSASAMDYSYPYHTGVVQSKDSFYGQHSPNSMPAGFMLQNKWNAWKKAGVLASEMECAALFTVAAVRKIRAGAVLTAVWNQESEKAAGNTTDNAPQHTNAIQTAVAALRRIIQNDR